MKKIFVLLITMLLLAGCGKEKLKSSIKESNGVYSVVLNNKEHTFKLEEEDTKKNKKKVSVYMDDSDIMSYTRVYNNNELWDHELVKLVKGEDNKSYLVYALANWSGTAFKQYFYIFNDEGNVIYKSDNHNFGMAFLDYNNVEEFREMYGDNGMVSIEEDRIFYLTEFYTSDEDYVRCQENILTINNSEITETKGRIIKVALVS